MFWYPLRKCSVGVWFWPVVLKKAKLYKVMKVEMVNIVQCVQVMEILWIARSEENMQVMGYWCFAWSKLSVHLSIDDGSNPIDLKWQSWLWDDLIYVDGILTHDLSMYLEIWVCLKFCVANIRLWICRYVHGFYSLQGTYSHKCFFGKSHTHGFGFWKSRTHADMLWRKHIQKVGFWWKGCMISLISIDVCLLSINEVFLMIYT